MFLLRKTLIAVTLNAELVIQPLNVGVSVCYDGSLPVKLGVQFGVLLPTIIVKATLFIYICS
jgi:hypothetical protein